MLSSSASSSAQGPGSGGHTAAGPSQPETVSLSLAAANQTEQVRTAMRGYRTLPRGSTQLPARRTHLQAVMLVLHRDLLLREYFWDVDLARTQQNRGVWNGSSFAAVLDRRFVEALAVAACLPTTAETPAKKYTDKTRWRTPWEKLRDKCNLVEGVDYTDYGGELVLSAYGFVAFTLYLLNETGNEIGRLRFLVLREQLMKSMAEKPVRGPTAQVRAAREGLEELVAASAGAEDKAAAFDTVAAGITALASRLADVSLAQEDETIKLPLSAFGLEPTASALLAVGAAAEAKATAPPAIEGTGGGGAPEAAAGGGRAGEEDRKPAAK